MGTVLCDLASRPWLSWLSKTSPVWGSYPGRRYAHRSRRHPFFCPTSHRARRLCLTLVAEAGFEPAKSFWDFRAYETRELGRATLLRDKWQVVPVLPRTRFALEAKLHSWCPT